MLANSFKKHPIIWRLAGIAVVVFIASAIFAHRNSGAYELPNFYAEDGQVFYNNLLTKHTLVAVFTPFNGYLVVGQYLVALLAYGLSLAGSGGELASLARWTALSSYLFLGATASLPFILFRKQLGYRLSLLAVLASSFVPIRNSDYAVIGTIGNLKFAWLYIAFMLLLYRNEHPVFGRKLITIDILLLVCVLTDVSAAFILPFGLWPYRQQIIGLAKQRSRAALTTVLDNKGIFGVLILGVLSVVYIAVVYLHGIPKMPGYLDTPYDIRGTWPLTERSTLYAWLYPFYGLMDNAVVAVSLLLVLVMSWLLRKTDRPALLLALWTVFLGTALFTLNRPGISSLYINYLNKGGPDQFFYSQNLVVIFITFWLLRDRFKRLSKLMKVFAIAVFCIYMYLALPFSSSMGQSRDVYRQRGTIDTNLVQACRQYRGKPEVIIPIYPVAPWEWKLAYNKAC